MDKEEILKKSRNENMGRYDERELAAFGNASKAGMLVGGVLCAVIVFLFSVFYDYPEICFTAFIIYFSMQASSRSVLYANLKKRSDLIMAIIEITLVIAFVVALVVKIAV